MLTQVVDMREIVQQAKGHFFDTSTLRMWNTRLPQTGYKVREGEYYWVQSDMGPAQGTRVYTVRMLRFGEVKKFDDQPRWDTRTQALRHMKSVLPKSE